MTVSGPAPDIMLLNANTDRSMTERILAHARRMHPGCRGATVATGAPYITDAASLREAAAAVRGFSDRLRDEVLPDALIVACFGDPAVGDLRGRLPFPVLGMAEAACHVACQTGRRFGIVTGGLDWPPILRALVDEIGLISRLSGIHALDMTGDRIAQDRAAAKSGVQAKIAEAEAAGADVIILGGAGLVGFASELQPDASVPLLDSVECAVSQALAIRRLWANHG